MEYTHTFNVDLLFSKYDAEGKLNSVGIIEEGEFPILFSKKRIEGQSNTKIVYIRIMNPK